MTVAGYHRTVARQSPCLQYPVFHEKQNRLAQKIEQDNQHNQSWQAEACDRAERQTPPQRIHKLAAPNFDGNCYCDNAYGRQYDENHASRSKVAGSSGASFGGMNKGCGIGWNWAPLESHDHS